MFFFRVCIMAMRSLWIHPLRSILATLGVIIGVAAVVAAMAILEGMSARMATGFESMGSNKLFVMPEVERRGRRAVGNFDSLKLEDAYEIERGCPSIARVMPQINNSVSVKFRSKTTNSTILGATEVYPLINNHNVIEGEFFTRSNVQGNASVVVLGAKVKQELFGGRPAIDEKVKVSGLGAVGTRTLTVVGVMEEKGNVGFTDVDRQIIVPITTVMEKIYGLKSIQTIVCEAASATDADIELGKNEIKKLLRMQHRIRAGRQDDFQVQAQKEFVQQFGQFQKIIGVVLGSIAGISLVVGGIGIMNIMLVSVTERTREIGIRLAIGALERDVLLQFLIEAVVLSCVGGLMGAALGLSASAAIAYWIGVPFVLSPMVVVVAFGFSAAVGIVFGFFPARRAAGLDPIEALRYE